MEAIVTANINFPGIEIHVGIVRFLGFKGEKDNH